MIDDKLHRQLENSINTRDRYEDLESQRIALQSIPLEDLKSRAIFGDNEEDDDDPEYRDRLLLELMRWYKESFFKWVNTPKCPGCDTDKDAKYQRTDTPLDDERAHGAGRAEIYQCNACECEYRFPRFNDPTHLLVTREGRCGEWANCFCLIARALGFEVRYVIDFTDHVWAEVFSKRLNRWIHCDCCEGPNTIDSPLMYEHGWGKKLTYIMAIGSDHVVDVTRKYTIDFEALIPRRTLATEEETARLVARYHRLQVAKALTKPGWYHESTTRRLIEEQLTMFFLKGQSLELKDAECQGRISGDASWKRLRGEDGGGKTANEN